MFLLLHSAFSGDAISELDLGDEVQYTLTKRSSRVSAEEIKKLPSGSVGPGEVSESSDCFDQVYVFPNHKSVLIRERETNIQNLVVSPVWSD